MARGLSKSKVTDGRLLIRTMAFSLSAYTEHSIASVAILDNMPSSRLAVALDGTDDKAPARFVSRAPSIAASNSTTQARRAKKRQYCHGYDARDRGQRPTWPAFARVGPHWPAINKIGRVIHRPNADLQVGCIRLKPLGPRGHGQSATERPTARPLRLDEAYPLHEAAPFTELGQLGRKNLDQGGK